jgi:hypothetical protein
VIPHKKVVFHGGCGILKAWTMNVVPNRARITVMASDSKYSRAVDFLNVSPAISLQILEGLLRRRLFGGALREPDTLSNDSPIKLHLNGE